MLDFSIAKPEDKEKWDVIVEKSPNATLAHTLEWKAVIGRCSSTDTFHTLIRGDGQVIGIIPLFSKNIYNDNRFNRILKFNLRTLNSPYPLGWVYGGPCIISSEDNEIMEGVLDYIGDFARKNAFVDIKIQPFIESDSWRNLYLRKDYKLTEGETSFIDLTKSLDDLWKDLNKKTRNSTNKALKNDLTITKAKEKKDVATFYSLYKKLIERTGIPMYPYSYYEAIWDILVPKKMARFYFVEYDNKKVGSLLAFYHKKVITYAENATLERYLRLCPNNLLLWTVIDEGKKLGYELFDLGGLPQDKTHGIYRFKTGWGGEINRYGVYKKELRLSGLRRLKNNVFKKRF